MRRQQNPGPGVYPALYSASLTFGWLAGYLGPWNPWYLMAKPVAWAILRPDLIAQNSPQGLLAALLKKVVAPIEETAILPILAIGISFLAARLIISVIWLAASKGEGYFKIQVTHSIQDLIWLIGFRSLWWPYGKQIATPAYRLIAESAQSDRFSGVILNMSKPLAQPLLGLLVSYVLAIACTSFFWTLAVALYTWWRNRPRRSE